MKRSVRRWCRRLAWPLLALAVLAGAGGCRTVEPVTGRRQFILTSPDAEMSMSLDAWQEILAAETPSTDSARTAAVRRVGGNISRAIDVEGFEWEFRLFSSEQANAFCLPGGKVAVYEGLFEFLSNDAELAAVIGHEIGHATARHGGERMTQAMMVDLGAAGLSVALKDKTDEARERWLTAYVGIGAVGFILPYSRMHEYAADEIGLVYMARAGYDPNAAGAFWQKFAEGKSSNSILEFLSTHPIGEKRTDRIREQLPRALAEYDMAVEKHGLGTVYGD